ncbi:hypothetical protein [Paraburkholderia sp. PGU19]|uniref:hypothetical protein n=1 Tax=Paraburkholderia sp. PGU19 TaxID=2735434 RepID=UPI0015DA8586|nr:hypothetical protein [Paraburkholderia sp. PGU19]
MFISSMRKAGGASIELCGFAFGFAFAFAFVFAFVFAGISDALARFMRRPTQWQTPAPNKKRRRHTKYNTVSARGARQPKIRCARQIPATPKPKPKPIHPTPPAVARTANPTQA